MRWFWSLESEIQVNSDLAIIQPILSSETWLGNAVGFGDERLHPQNHDQMFKLSSKLPSGRSDKLFKTRCRKNVNPTAIDAGRDLSIFVFSVLALKDFRG